MNKPIKFEREFDVKKVGNSQKLPRGKSIAGGYGDTDRDYWRSIFNGGEAADFKMKLEEERQSRLLSEYNMSEKQKVPSENNSSIKSGGESHSNIVHGFNDDFTLLSNFRSHDSSYNSSIKRTFFG